MNCRSVAHDLTELREGKLPAVRKALLRFHLSVCPACKTYAGQIDRTVAALHDADEPLDEEASAALAARLLGARK
ncbi:hypothetical protein BH09MYX1_BH09MYX1_22670 [soil metagenome]